MASLALGKHHGPEFADSDGLLVGPSSPHLQIAAILRTMVFEGRLASGTLIAESQLCRQLGISVTPLREALKILASLNLVNLLPNHVAIVARIAGEETIELFEVMEGLEAAVGALVVERIMCSEIEELKALHRVMLEHHRFGRRAEYFTYNQRVHQRLVESARNRTLAREHLNYSQEIMRARYAANYRQSRWDESACEHTGILNALEQRDGALLSSLMRDHLRRTSRGVVTMLGPMPQTPLPSP